MTTPTKPRHALSFGLPIDIETEVENDITVVTARGNPHMVGDWWQSFKRRYDAAEYGTKIQADDVLGGVRVMKVSREKGIS